MDPRHIRNIIIVIGVIFIAAVVFGLAHRSSVDEGSITDYLEEMAPTAQAHIEWRQDYNTLTELYDVLSLNQKLEQLNQLAFAMEDIRLSVEGSNPPTALSYMRARWHAECQKTVQGIYYIRLGLSDNNIQWITKGYESLAEADEARQQWQEELSKVLDENGITLADPVYNSYFG
jgi:hypothetical protein